MAEKGKAKGGPVNEMKEQAEAAAAAAAAANAPKGGGNKLLLIIGLAVGLAAGGGGAWFFFSHQAKTATAGGDTTNAAAGKAEAKAEPAEVEAPQFIDVRKLPASLVDENGNLIGYVFFDLKLEVANDADQKYVFDRLPIIVDALIKDIPDHPVSKAGRPGDVDYERATARFAVVANQALGGGDRVKAVQIANVTRQ